MIKLPVSCKISFTFAILFFILASFPSIAKASNHRCGDYNVTQQCAFVESLPVTYPSGCSGARDLYNCNGLTCAIESAPSCSVVQRVCEYNSDRYNCGEAFADPSYCKTVLQGGDGVGGYGSINTWPPNRNSQNAYCGKYKDSDPRDPRPYCDDWWNACLASCEGATSDTNYACPGVQQCDQSHVCVTQAPQTTLLVNSQSSVTITEGNSATLAWSSVRAETCTASGAWSGGKVHQGSESTGDLSVRQGDGNQSTYTYTLTCSNTAGSGNSPVSVTVIVTRAATPNTPTPTTPVITNTPTPTATTAPPWTCDVWSTEGDRNAAGGACNANEYCVELGGTYNDPNNAIRWPVQQNWTWGSNLTPARTFKSFPYNSSTLVNMTAVDNSGSGTSQACTPKTVNVGPQSNPGGTTPTPNRGGGRATPTPTTGQPLSGTGAIRFFNSNCITPYTGPSTLRVLTHAQFGDGSWENGNGHNSLFYPSVTHSSAQDTGICDRREWHYYYDPGYQISSDGTFAGCPAQNMDGTGEWVCTGQPDCGYNAYGDWECQQCPGYRDGEGNDVCKEDTDSEERFPRCFSAFSSPATITSANPTLSVHSERSMQRTFSVGAPTGVRIKVIRVCTGDGCNWSRVGDPSVSPNGGGGASVVKDFGTSSAGPTNYFASPMEGADGNTSSYVYDVCVEDGTGGVTVGGNVFTDYGCDGRKDAVDTNYGGARIRITGGSTDEIKTTDSSGNYTSSALVKGQNYTADVEVPSGHRASTTDPLVYNNLNSNITNANFGFCPTASSWFQTKDSDLLSSGNMNSSIPRQCVQQLDSCSPYLSLNGDGGYPGVPVYNGTLSLGWGTVSANTSSTGWNANTRYTGRAYTYASFAAKMPTSGVTTTPDTIDSDGYFSLSGTPDSNGYKWFKATGNLTINGEGNINNQKVILFVPGNLTINNRVRLRKGEGFFAVFVGGEISISPEVIYQSQPAPKSNSQPGLEGMFFADGNIRTGTRSTATPVNDDQLFVRGALVSKSGILLQRDLDPARSGTGNNTTPSEFVEYAPDLVFNFPTALSREGVVWEEVAP